MLRLENRICSIIHNPRCGSYSAIPLQAFDIYYVQTLKAKCVLNAKCFSNPDDAARSFDCCTGVSTGASIRSKSIRHIDLTHVSYAVIKLMSHVLRENKTAMTW